MNLVHTKAEESHWWQLFSVFWSGCFTKLDVGWGVAGCCRLLREMFWHPVTLQPAYVPAYGFRRMEHLSNFRDVECRLSDVRLLPTSPDEIKHSLKTLSQLHWVIQTLHRVCKISRFTSRLVHKPRLSGEFYIDLFVYFEIIRFKYFNYKPNWKWPVKLEACVRFIIVWRFLNTKKSDFYVFHAVSRVFSKYSGAKFSIETVSILLSLFIIASNIYIVN